MELIPKEEKEELISDEVNMLENRCSDADVDTSSACLFVIPPQYLDAVADLMPNISYDSSIRQNYLCDRVRLLVVLVMVFKTCKSICS